MTALSIPAVPDGHVGDGDGQTEDRAAQGQSHLPVTGDRARRVRQDTVGVIPSQSGGGRVGRTPHSGAKRKMGLYDRSGFDRLVYLAGLHGLFAIDEHRLDATGRLIVFN